MDVPTLMALLGFLTLGGNIIVSIWNYRNETKRTQIAAISSDAKAASDLTQAWKPYVDELRTQMLIQKKQMEDLRAADETKTRLLITAVSGMSILIQQLKERGIKPDWTMPPELAALLTEIPTQTRK
jgi:hypothetical protein